MEIIAQIGVVLAVSLAGEALAALLPFPFPASVLGMVLLLVLLAAKVLRPHHIREKTNFLLDNMPLFFVPACVSILKYADVLAQNVWALLVICVCTVPLVFGVTGHTVQLTLRLMERGKERGHD